jgi:hypothetical protein
MSDLTDEEVAVAELITKECWRAHQEDDEADDEDCGPAEPARRFAEWHAGGCAGTLDLQECGLSSLPAALCEVAPQLRSLNLNHNHLLSLPGALLARCTALLRLDCHDNLLSSLPADIGQCTALQTLSCYSNELSSLPAELGACTALQELWCFDNQLSTLPVHLGLLDLQLLECEYNKFVEGAPTTIDALRAAAQGLGRRTKRARVAETPAAEESGSRPAKSMRSGACDT